MKKFVAFLFLAILPSHIHAAITDPQVVQEKSVALYFSTPIAANKNLSFDLISLSTTTGLFPHLDHGEIDISHIDVVMDKIAASTTTVKIGVVNFVNTSTGSVTFFYSKTAVHNVSNTAGTDFLNFTPTFIRCKVKPNNTAISTDVDGLTPYIISNDKISGSTVYNSSATVSMQLPSIVGPITPRPGDIVMQVITDASNAVNILVNLVYHSEP